MRNVMGNNQLLMWGAELSMPIASPSPLLPKYQGVYKIICIPTGKIYIGSSLNMSNRQKTHISTLKKNTSHCIKLQRAFNKYGERYFSFEIVEIVQDKKSLAKKEKNWIEKYNSVKLGLNVAIDTNAPMLGRKHNKRTKAKMRKNIYRTGMNKWWLGKNFSQEHKDNIGKSNKGKKRPDFGLIASRINSKNRGEKNNFWGRKHSEETKAKIRKNHPNIKLKESDVIKIKELLSGGLSQAKIGNLFNVSQQMIWRIKHKKSWPNEVEW